MNLVHNLFLQPNVNLQTLSGAPINNVGVQPLSGVQTLSGGNEYRVPSAFELQRASELEKGMMLAKAAGENILGEKALQKEVSERTPFGINFGSSYLSPLMLSRSTQGDPWGGAVTAADNPGSVAGVGPARGG